MGVFNTRFKGLREEKGYTQKQLAEAIHTTPQNISAYEKDREPPYETLRNIAKFFKVTVDYLIGYTKPIGNRNIEIDFTNLVTLEKRYKQLLSSKYASKYMGLSDEAYRFAKKYVERDAFLSIYPYNGIHDIIDFVTSVDKGTDVEEFAKKCFKLSSKLQSTCQYMFDKFLDTKELDEYGEEE